jgi:hypothetical protein
MTKETILKIAGVTCTIVGATCLFLSGAGESMVSALVGGVFILASLVFTFFKK